MQLQTSNTRTSDLPAPLGADLAHRSSVLRRRRLRGALLSIAVLVSSLGAATAVATPAQAASNGGVYIVAPKSWGWCPNVRGVYNRPTQMHVTNYTSGETRSDGGDDIIWVGVNMNQSNTVQVNVGCSLGHGSAGTLVRITPRRNGQAFYVSPGGYAWGN